MNDKVPCSSTKLIRGGTAYSSSPFELNLQLHGQVNNPYSFGIKQNYKSSAITKVSIPPYTEKSWTTPGTYTWTVPAGVTRIRVAVCGGGGGGRASIDNGTASSGKTSSIKRSNTELLKATGGSGGRTQSKWMQDNDNNWTEYYGYGGTGGTPNGKNGGSHSQSSGSVSGGAGFALNFNLANGNYGKGGNASGSMAQAGGGSGGYNTSYLEIISSETLTIVVGEAGGNGTSGFVLIAYGEGIE